MPKYQTIEMEAYLLGKGEVLPIPKPDPPLPEPEPEPESEPEPDPEPDMGTWRDIGVGWVIDEYAYKIQRKFEKKKGPFGEYK